MNKADYVKYWVNSAKDYAKSYKALFASKRYLHALFFGHLHLEKICKAIWVKNNADNFPPRTHNLIRLVETASIQLTEEI